MAQLNNILRYYSCWFNRIAYMGEVCDVKVPNVRLKMEEFRGGGMDMPIEVDLGMEKMETEFKLYSWDPNAFSRFGQLVAQQRTPLSFRGHFQGQDSNPQIGRVLINMDVRAKERNSDNWKAGQKSEVTIKLAVDFYEEYHNDRLIYRFNPLGFTRIVDGIDQLAAARVSLGLATPIQ